MKTSLKKTLRTVLFLAVLSICSPNVWAQDVLKSGPVKFQYAHPSSDYYLSTTNLYNQICIGIETKSASEAKTFHLDMIDEGRYLIALDYVKLLNYTVGRYMFSYATPDMGYEFDPMPDQETLDNSFLDFVVDWRLGGYVLSVTGIRIGNTLYVTDSQTPSDISMLDEMADAGTIKKIDLNKANNFIFSFAQPEAGQGYPEGAVIITSESGGEITIDGQSGTAIIQDKATSMSSIFIPEQILEDNTEQDEVKEYNPLGNGLSWKYDGTTLTISKTGEGSGEMPEDNNPWVSDLVGNLISVVKEIILDEGVTSISDNAFYGCINTTSVTIPSTVKAIGNEAFRYGRITGELTIPEGVTYIGFNAFANCEFITGLNLPSTLRDIDIQAFGWCFGLTGKLDIPEGVTSIGFGAFTLCAINSVTIPSTVNDIGSHAFQNCGNLTEVIIKNDIPPVLGAYAFRETPLSAIYVPSGSLEAYKTAPGWWSEYANIIKSDETGLESINNPTLSVYPNPTSESITITGIETGETIRIYNLSGALLGTYTATSEKLTIDISNLAKGTYLLKTSAQSFKIIKN